MITRICLIDVYATTKYTFVICQYISKKYEHRHVQDSRFLISSAVRGEVNSESFQML